MKLFDIHSAIGKFFSIVCLSLGGAAILGLIIGTTRCAKENDVVETNHFLNEKIPIHNGNYDLEVHDVKNIEVIYVKNKKGELVELNGQYICVNLTVFQKNDSSIDSHKIDSNDFKLKDHTGVYLPLNNIMGALGWDAIDIHIDSKDGGYVISSTDFTTTNTFEDYSYIGFELSPGVSKTLDLYFQMDRFIDVSKDLVVLEVDFFYFSNDYKKGTDVILLSNPFVDNNSQQLL